MPIISGIHVENYRSLVDFKLDLQPLTILIGRNDAGKSNTLKAIQLLLDDQATQSISHYDWNKIITGVRFPRQTSISATLAGETFTHIRRRITINKANPPISTLEILDENNWREVKDCDKNHIPTFYYLKPRTGALQELFAPQLENNIFTLVKDWMPDSLSKERDLHKLMRAYKKGTNLAAYVSFFDERVLPALAIAFPSDITKLIRLNPEFRNPSDRGRLFVREMNYHADRTSLLRTPIDHRGSGLISSVALVLSIAVLQEHHRLQLNNR